MKKKSFSLGLAVVLIMSNLIFGSNVFAAESSSKSIPKLDTIQRIVPGQRIKANLNEDHFYKIDIKGQTYIIEDKSTLVDVNKSSSSGFVSASTTDTTKSGYVSRDFNIYSVAGVLQGTLHASQDWSYNNGKFVSVPDAKAHGTVPSYSWPNYWTNLNIDHPTYNSSTKYNTSSVEEDLKLSVPCPVIGTFTFETMYCYVDLVFDAYGHCYTTAWSE